MSTDSTKSFTPNASQGDFWGGYMLDHGVLLKFLTYFPLTGLFGLDKLILRSPLTALLKFLVNICFLGAWYLYDCVQLFFDEEREIVANFGFSNPFGPSGHGFRLIRNLTENNLKEFPTAAAEYGGFFGTIMFLLYCISLLPLGFSGIPSAIAGDFSGGIIKFFSNFLVLPLVFYILFTPLEFAKSGSIEKDGVSRTWPLSPWFMLKDKYPATNLLEPGLAEKQAKAYEISINSLVKEGKKPDVPATFSNAVDSVGNAITNFPPVAVFATASAAKGGILAAADTGQALAKAVQKKLASDPDAVVDKLLGITVPTVSVPTVSVPTVLKQAGGGLQLSTDLDKVIFGGMALLVLGGFAAAFYHKITPSQKNGNERSRKVDDRDDTPPVPGGI